MSERQIHITRQGAQYGPYPESSVKDMLAEGQLLPTDLAWYEGAESWQPLQELLGTKVVETPPPVPQDIKPEEQSDDGKQSGKIRVMRNGEAIGPYSWDKAREYFITGQLLPTDVACTDAAGEDWKPLNEVLGLPAPIPMSTSSGAKSGKGKKIAMIAGISVLVIGLITVGILYGPKLLDGGDGGGLLGGGKNGALEELAERAVKALKNNDKDAMFGLSLYSFSKSDLERMVDDLEKSMEPLAKEQGMSVEEILREIGDSKESLVSDIEEGREKVREILSSCVEEIRSSAIEDGVDWSDVTISEIKEFGISDTPEGIVYGRVYVSITSKGKDFVLRLQCMHAPSIGLSMNERPHWEGPGGIGSWGLAPSAGAQKVGEMLSHRGIGKLGKGINDYAYENKQKMPAANKWCDEIFNEVGGGKAFISPQAPDAKKLKTNAKHCHYAMNAAVAGKQIIRRPFEVKTVVVLFESDLGWNGSGGLEDAKKFAKDRKARRLAVFFADGQSKLVSPKELDQLKWTP